MYVHDSVVKHVTAKIGGWIGLIVGASLISFIEFLYFVCLLFKRCVLREKSI